MSEGWNIAILGATGAVGDQWVKGDAAQVVYALFAVIAAA